MSTCCSANGAVELCLGGGNLKTPIIQETTTARNWYVNVLHDVDATPAARMSGEVNLSLCKEDTFHTQQTRKKGTVTSAHHFQGDIVHFDADCFSPKQHGTGADGASLQRRPVQFTDKKQFPDHIRSHHLSRPHWWDCPVSC